MDTKFVKDIILFKFILNCTFIYEVLFGLHKNTKLHCVLLLFKVEYSVQNSNRASHVHIMWDAKKVFQVKFHK